MAAFACFSNLVGRTEYDYKDLIQRLRYEAERELDQKITPTISFRYIAKSRKQNNFKDFAYNIRKRTCDDVPSLHLLNKNPTPILKNFIRLIETLKLQDGRHCNAYYGELKNIITSFMNYITFVIDDIIKNIDNYTHNLNNKLFVELIDGTVTMYEHDQTEFLKEYLPLTSDEEKANYQEIIEGQFKFVTKLGEIREAWETREDRLDWFANNIFDASLKKLHKLLNYTHIYISEMLAERIYEISQSLQETVDRMNTNLQNFNQESTNRTHNLIGKMYEKNKLNLQVYRHPSKSFLPHAAEIGRSLQRLRDKIENLDEDDETVVRLELENRYWHQRLREFNEIAIVLARIIMELQELQIDLEKYRSVRCTELPGSKTMCFELIGEGIADRMSYLREKHQLMSRALLTYFCVRGTDRALYTDHIGSYYCDEFNHQNYRTNYGLKYFHVNCNGDFVENIETEPYYFDENGRFILQNDEKIYQSAPCTSQYKLGVDGLFKKITPECGHSDKHVPECRLDIKDLTDVVILPKNEPINISGTLDKESVKYLWDNFGNILPQVLCKVVERQSKNPISLMAHFLEKCRLEMTTTERSRLKEEARAYRQEVEQERLKPQQRDLERDQFRRKCLKRDKLEDFDESLNWEAHGRITDWFDATGYYYD